MKEISKIIIHTVKCWKSHAFIIFVAILGKIPLFFCFLLSFSSSSSLNIESSESGIFSVGTPLVVSEREIDERFFYQSIYFIMSVCGSSYLFTIKVYYYRIIRYKLLLSKVTIFWKEILFFSMKKSLWIFKKFHVDNKNFI